jgi:hypothetical protein
MLANTDITGGRMFMKANDYFEAIPAIQSEWGTHVREFNKETEANAWKMEITTAVGVARAAPRLGAIKEDNPNNGM